MLFEILSYMREKGEATAEDIASTLGFEETVIEMGLNDLCKKGRIERVIVRHVPCALCSCGCYCSDNELFRYSTNERDK